MMAIMGYWWIVFPIYWWNFWSVYMFRVELRDIMMNGRRIKFSATCHALVYGMISHSATITHYHIFSSFGVFNLWFNHWVRYINVAMI